MEESDYIKRNIELYKYLFSSSAALLLIIVWKTMTEFNTITNDKDIPFWTIVIMGSYILTAMLCLLTLRQ